MPAASSLPRKAVRLPPRSSVTPTTPPALPPPTPRPRDRATARRGEPPPRRWRRCPGSLACHRASLAPGRAWAGRDWRGSRRETPSLSRSRAASAPPPAPAAAPPRPSVAPPLQPAPPLLPAPPATARCTAPPPRRWRSCPGTFFYHVGLACHRPCLPLAPDRAWTCRLGGARRSSPPCSRPRAASAPPPAPAAAPPGPSVASPLQPALPPPPAPPATA
eukprot:scaffold126938_cov60-Phaeocystis_antarctica.AAC.4